MSYIFNVVVILGSLQWLLCMLVLIDVIVIVLGVVLLIEMWLIEFGEIGSWLVGVLMCVQVLVDFDVLICMIEMVDVLVVVSLVYCVLYMGFFKYLFDFVCYDVFVDVLVLFVVIGGSEWYVFVIDY